MVNGPSQVQRAVPSALSDTANLGAGAWPLALAHGASETDSASRQASRAREHSGERLF